MMNDPIPNLIAFDAVSLDNAFAAVGQQAREDASALAGPDAVEAFRLKWLGRKQGLLNEVSSRWLKAAPPDAKKAVGERFKTLKELVERLLDESSGAGPSDAALAAEAIDITLPGTTPRTRSSSPTRNVAPCATASCCALTPRPCRCAPWNCNRRRCAL